MSAGRRYSDAAAICLQHWERQYEIHRKNWYPVVGRGHRFPGTGRAEDPPAGSKPKGWSSVQRLLGLERRSPTAKEAQFADRWINEWRFSEDLIREAYERNVDAKGKFSFPYMNSILERWKKEGVETLEQAQNEKKPFQELPAEGRPPLTI